MISNSGTHGEYGWSYLDMEDGSNVYWSIYSTQNGSIPKGEFRKKLRDRIKKKVNRDKKMDCKVTTASSQTWAYKTADYDVFPQVTTYRWTSDIKPLSFGNLPETTTIQNNKEKKMMYLLDNDCYDCSEVSDEMKQRRYLGYRLNDIADTKQIELRKVFHLDEDAPKSPAEIVQRIKDGKIKFPTDDEWKALKKARPWASPMAEIEFREFDADKEGYDKAVDEVKKAKTAAEDLIAVSTPADGLKALQDFEAKTFH